jgi:hypothetical protein
MKLTRTTRNVGWLVVAGLLGAALIAPGGVAAGTGPEVTPTTYEGNIKVEDCPEGTTGLYLDDETTSESGGGVTVSIDYDSDAKTTDFTATGGLVMHAFIKGGDAYNHYDYSGMGGIAADDGLVAPNNSSGGPAGLSHAVFCVVETTETETTETETTETETTETETTTTATGSVQSTTSKAKPTPPSTDTVVPSSPSSTTGSPWSLLLVAMAALLAATLLLTPAVAARKR